MKSTQTEKTATAARNAVQLSKQGPYAWGVERDGKLIAQGLSKGAAEALAKTATACQKTPEQIAQYGEGDTKFYASKRGSTTLSSYKLDYAQREEINKLLEQCENNLEFVLFRLVFERDTFQNEAKRERDWNEHLRIQLQAEVDKANRLQAHAEPLAEAFRKLLLKLDTITSDQFQFGAEREEREKAREALARWEAK